MHFKRLDLHWRQIETTLYDIAGSTRQSRGVHRVISFIRQRYTVQRRPYYRPSRDHAYSEWYAGACSDIAICIAASASLCASQYAHVSCVAAGPPASQAGSWKVVGNSGAVALQALPFTDEQVLFIARPLNEYGAGDASGTNYLLVGRTLVKLAPSDCRIGKCNVTPVGLAVCEVLLKLYLALTCGAETCN